MSESDQQRDPPPGAGRNGNVPPESYRWKPGQSGNPGGRPKNESLTARLRRLLEQEHGGKVIADLVAERIVKEALSGKFPFAKELIDRLEGPLNQRHDIKQNNDVRIIVADARGHERLGTHDDIRDLAMGINLPAPGDMPPQWRQEPEA